MTYQHPAKDTTKAEREATAAASRLEHQGLVAEIVVTDTDPTYYEYDGSVMIPAQRIVHLHAKEDHILGDSLNATWRSTTQAVPGSRRTTKFYGGDFHRFAGRWEKIKTERDFWFRLGMLCWRKCERRDGDGRFCTQDAYHDGNHEFGN